MPTIFGWKRPAICAYSCLLPPFESTNVTWLNSRSPLAACDWLLSALSAMLLTHVRRRRKSGEFSCTECTGQGYDFELIPAVKMETRHPVEGSFGNEFPSICSHCGVMAAWSRKIWKKLPIFVCFRRTTPLQGNFQNPVSNIFVASPIDVL